MHARGSIIYAFMYVRRDNGVGGEGCAGRLWTLHMGNNRGPDGPSKIMGTYVAVCAFDVCGGGTLVIFEEGRGLSPASGCEKRV